MDGNVTNDRERESESYRLIFLTLSVVCDADSKKYLDVN